MDYRRRTATGRDSQVVDYAMALAAEDEEAVKYARNAWHTRPNAFKKHWDPSLPNTEEEHGVWDSGYGGDYHDPFWGSDNGGNESWREETGCDTQTNKEEFYAHISGALGASRADNLRFIHSPPLRANNPSSQGPNVDYATLLQYTADRFGSNYYLLATVLKRGSHGFPLSHHNCFDLWRYRNIVGVSAKVNNTTLCIRKIMRVYVCANTEFRSRLSELGPAGGLFVFLNNVKVLELFVAHYSATNAIGSTINYMLYLKMFVDQYWSCISLVIMERMKDGTTYRQMDNIIHSTKAYLSHHHKAGKRALSQDKYVRQAVQYKLSNYKAPPVSGYRFVLTAINMLLDKSYKALLIQGFTCPLGQWFAHMAHGQKAVHDTVQNAQWALHEHFMYHTNAQRMFYWC
jgi:hypothetical protein